MKPISIVEDETIMRESPRDWLTDNGYQVEIKPKGFTAEAMAELNSWDEEGRVLAEQTINRFSHLFPYFFKEEPAY